MGEYFVLKKDRTKIVQIVEWVSNETDDFVRVKILQGGTGISWRDKYTVGEKAFYKDFEPVVEKRDLVILKLKFD